MSLNRKPRGIRAKIPAGYIVGRKAGTGSAQLIRLADISTEIQAAVIGTVAGGAGATVSAAFADGTSSPVTLTSGVPINIYSLVLAAGTYDVEGTVTFNPLGWTTFTDARIGISTTPGALPAPPAKGGYTNLTGSFSVTATQFTISTGVTRVALPAGGSVYLVAQATFS